MPPAFQAVLPPTDVIPIQGLTSIVLRGGGGGLKKQVLLLLSGLGQKEALMSQ